MTDGVQRDIEFHKHPEVPAARLEGPLPSGQRIDLRDHLSELDDRVSKTFMETIADLWQQVCKWFEGAVDQCKEFFCGKEVYEVSRASHYRQQMEDQLVEKFHDRFLLSRNAAQIQADWAVDGGNTKMEGLAERPYYLMKWWWQFQWTEEGHLVDPRHQQGRSDPDYFRSVVMGVAKQVANDLFIDKRYRGQIEADGLTRQQLQERLEGLVVEQAEKVIKSVRTQQYQAERPRVVKEVLAFAKQLQVDLPDFSEEHRQGVGEAISTLVDALNDDKGTTGTVKKLRRLRRQVEKDLAPAYAAKARIERFRPYEAHTAFLKSRCQMMQAQGHDAAVRVLQAKVVEWQSLLELIKAEEGEQRWEQHKEILSQVIERHRTLLALLERDPATVIAERDALVMQGCLTQGRLDEKVVEALKITEEAASAMAGLEIPDAALKAAVVEYQQKIAAAAAAGNVAEVMSETQKMQNIVATYQQRVNEFNSLIVHANGVSGLVEAIKEQEQWDEGAMAALQEAVVKMPALIGDVTLKAAVEGDVKAFRAAVVSKDHQQAAKHAQNAIDKVERYYAENREALTQVHNSVTPLVPHWNKVAVATGVLAQKLTNDAINEVLAREIASELGVFGVAITDQELRATVAAGKKAVQAAVRAGDFVGAIRQAKDLIYAVDSHYKRLSASDAEGHEEEMTQVRQEVGKLKALSITLNREAMDEAVERGDAKQAIEFAEEMRRTIKKRYSRQRQLDLAHPAVLRLYMDAGQMVKMLLHDSQVVMQANVGAAINTMMAHSQQMVGAIEDQQLKQTAAQHLQLMQQALMGNDVAAAINVSRAMLQTVEQHYAQQAPTATVEQQQEMQKVGGHLRNTALWSNVLADIVTAAKAPQRDPSDHADVAEAVKNKAGPKPWRVLAEETQGERREAILRVGKFKEAYEEYQQRARQVIVTLREGGNETYATLIERKLARWDQRLRESNGTDAVKRDDYLQSVYSDIRIKAQMAMLDRVEAHPDWTQQEQLDALKGEVFAKTKEAIERVQGDAEYRAALRRNLGQTLGVVGKAHWSPENREFNKLIERGEQLTRVDDLDEWSDRVQELIEHGSDLGKGGIPMIPEDLLATLAQREFLTWMMMQFAG